MNSKSKPVLFSRREFLSFSVISTVSGVLGCTTDGNFSILGYSSQPNYDKSIATVHVPIFKILQVLTVPHREIEIRLTQDVITAIEQYSPYKQDSNPDTADTELLGTVVSFSKNILNRTQQNDAREVEYVLSVDLVWRDLRNEKVLSNPINTNDLSQIPPFDPSNPPLPPAVEKPNPKRIQGKGRAIPELGQSSATAEQTARLDCAMKIVQNMEKPWNFKRAKKG